MSPVLSAARANLYIAPIGVVLAVVSSALVARWLEPEVFADYATLTALLAWITLLAEGGCNVGFGRYVKDAKQHNAENSLYKTLQLRRWVIIAFGTAFLVFFGPVWASHVGFTESRWSARTFLMLGLLSGIMMHGQLANAALISAFHHQKALITSQIMMIVRAAVLIAMAGVFKEPISLIVALIAVAFIETIVMHGAVSRLYKNENDPLPPKLATEAQKHGMVSQFDKITSTLCSGSFLVLVLAANQSRTDLAMLAVATDMLQKVLSLIGLPVSNLIMPVLNDSRGDKERYFRNVDLFFALTVIMFSVSAGAIAVALPSGIRFLLGEAYAPAVPLALIWLVPLFIESAVRMVLGAGLLTLDYRKWFMCYNAAFGLVSVVFLAAAYSRPLPEILAGLGVIRCVMSFILCVKAHEIGIFKLGNQPWKIFFPVIAATGLSFAVLRYLEDLPNIFQLAAGLAVYGITALLLTRITRAIPPLVRDALFQVAGKFSPAIKLLC